MHIDLAAWITNDTALTLGDEDHHGSPAEG